MALLVANNNGMLYIICKAVFLEIICVFIVLLFLFVVCLTSLIHSFILLYLADVITWTPAQVADWVGKQKGYESIATLFIQQDIAGKHLIRFKEGA